MHSTIVLSSFFLNMEPLYVKFLYGLRFSINCFSDPDMLKDGIVRKPSMSWYLPTSWSKSGRCHNYSSSSMSAYSTCSSGEGEVFSSSSSESEENETEIEQEGESKLTLSKCVCRGLGL